MIDLTGQSLPSALARGARWERLGVSEIPVMLVHPDRASGDAARAVPVVIWMHGRTVAKEIDPGRHLRLMRRGIGVCAVDLPGHGERYDAELQRPERALDVVLQMIDEIDEVVDALGARTEFDHERMGIGGMSAGGMATLARLCHAHPFRAASVEATTGDWTSQRKRRMFRDVDAATIRDVDPIANLDEWREIPLQAIHAVHDEWVGIEGQRAFLDALRLRYERPELIEFIEYGWTGAAYEHAGFGRYSADAKSRQAAFFAGHLTLGE